MQKADSVRQGLTKEQKLTECGPVSVLEPHSSEAISHQNEHLLWMGQSLPARFGGPAALLASQPPATGRARYQVKQTPSMLHQSNNCIHVLGLRLNDGVSQQQCDQHAMPALSFVTGTVKSGHSAGGTHMQNPALSHSADAAVQHVGGRLTLTRSDGGRVSACRKHSRSPDAAAAPAFICTARPLPALMTLSANPLFCTSIIVLQQQQQQQQQ